MQIYNTKTEKSERDFLELLGFNIVCPNRDLHFGNDMDLYLRLVAKCKSVVCSEYSGFIGKGVYLELAWALRHKIPCFLLRERKIYRIINITEYNTDDWQTTYGKIGKIEELTFENTH
jgi:hypothetical protein